MQIVAVWRHRTQRTREFFGSAGMRLALSPAMADDDNGVTASKRDFEGHSKARHRAGGDSSRKAIDDCRDVDGRDAGADIQSAAREACGLE